MVLRTNTPSTWMQGLEMPPQLFGDSGSDYELYEEDDESGPSASDIDDVLEEAETEAE